MAIERKMPPVEVVQAEVDAGLTDREIAEKYGVSIETVRSYRKRHNISRTLPRDESVPWTVKKVHSGNIALRHLRNYGRRQRGVPLKYEDEKPLDEFIEYMCGGNHWGVPLVLVYDSDEGFSLEPKMDGDSEFARP